MKRKPERAAVVAALLLVQVFFGLHYLAAKLVIEQIPPRAWASFRVGAAAAILFAVAVLLRRSLRLPRRDLGELALYSLFGVVINQVCFVEGLHRTTPTHSAIINTTIPVGTLLFAVVLGRERIDLRKVLALSVSFAGVMLVIHPDRASFSSATFLGDLLTLANATSYSLFLVLSKRLLSRIDPLAATTWLLGFGAIGILAIGGSELSRVRPSQISGSVWVLGVFIVLCATVVTYFLNYWALARVDSSVVALFIYLQPLIATALSAAVLGDRPEVQVLAGGGLIFAGVYLSIRNGRAAPAALRSA